MPAETPPDTGEEMEIVTSTDGTEITVQRTGSGPPLVLVHGTGADYTSWEEIRPALAEHVTIYAMDRRGRRESGDAAEYALEREREDVAAVVDSIAEPVNLFGHSYGGLCALEAALQTDNLSGLILYEPALPVVGHELYSEDLLTEMEALIADGKKEQAVVLFYQKVPELSSEQIDALRSAPTWPTRVDAAHTLLREMRAEVEYEFDAARFEEMTTPTLLLSGSESPQWAKEMTALANDALPNSRIVTLDGQGHVAYYSAPALFVDEVLAFIRETS